MNHDAIFKRVVRTCFRAFLGLFTPDLLEQLDLTNLTFLDKETFAEGKKPKRRDADLVAQVGLRGMHNALIIVHVEHQARNERGFERRMLRYFLRLHDRYDLPVYPIALLSYDRPRTSATDHYQVVVAGFHALDFRYRVIQLNQYDWKAYLQRDDPLATALAVKMGIPVQERGRAKLAALLKLFRTPLEVEQQAVLVSFVDMYLLLAAEEEAMIEQELITQLQAEDFDLALLTTWGKRGLAQGIAQGIAQGREEGREEGRIQGRREIVMRLLQQRFPSLSSEAIAQINTLSLLRLDALVLALLNFTSLGDLQTWLDSIGDGDGC